MRLVSEALAESDDWGNEAIFEPYAGERRERMRRLRETARQFSKYRCEYGERARARRQLAAERLAADPRLGLPFLVPLKGPSDLPPGAYTAAAWRRLYERTTSF